MNPDLTLLTEMLAYRRPAYSHTEHRFNQCFIAPTGATQDSEGNWSLELGHAPRTLWSAHTDTVHRVEHMQTLDIGPRLIALPQGRSPASSCLGADNTAGVWMLLELIKAGIPGLYVFHAAEELGCRGSSWLAKRPSFFRGIDFAIAFDRRSTRSIITHQGWGRSASDEFAAQLAWLIGMWHKPDDGGIYTDTASYMDIIPECTNVSAGFVGEHTRTETLNYHYLFTLRDAVVEQYDETQLEAVRDPEAENERFWCDYGSGSGYAYAGYHPDPLAWDSPWQNMADEYESAEGARVAPVKLLPEPSYDPFDPDAERLMLPHWSEQGVH